MKRDETGQTKDKPASNVAAGGEMQGQETAESAGGRSKDSDSETRSKVKSPTVPPKANESVGVSVAVENGGD